MFPHILRLQPLVVFADYIGSTLLRNHNITIYHHCFSLNTMASFWYHFCWLLHFKKILWLLFTDEYNNLLGLLITLEITLLKDQIIDIYHDCFYPSTMASFRCHHCLLLYFKVFLWLFLTYEWDNLFGLLLTLELIFQVIVLSSYITIVFLT